MFNPARLQPLYIETMVKGKKARFLQIDHAPPKAGNWFLGGDGLIQMAAKDFPVTERRVILRPTLNTIRELGVWDSTWRAGRPTWVEK